MTHTWYWYSVYLSKDEHYEVMARCPSEALRLLKVTGWYYDIRKIREAKEHEYTICAK